MASIVLMQGAHADRWGRPRKKYPAGRVCAASTCDTRLSIYNPRVYCWVHDVTRRKAVSDVSVRT